MILMSSALSERPHQTPTTQPVSAETIVASARPLAPAGTIPLRYEPARWNGDSAVVTFGPAGERHPVFRVMVDPGTGRTSGVHVTPAVIRFMHNLHADLLLLPYGQTATGIMGLLLVGMAITGVILWWPHPTLWATGKWRRTVVPSPRAKGYRWWRETHISIGFWTSLVLTFLAASGMVLAFPFSRPLFGVQPHADNRGGGEHHHAHGPENAAPLPGESGLDHALSLLGQRYPAGHVIAVQLGDNPRQQRFQVVLPAYGVNRPAQIRVDARADTVALAQDPGTQKTGAAVFQWLHMLHEARLSGPAGLAELWRAIVCLTGLALTFFSVSGAIMWAKRRGNRPRRQVDVAVSTAATPE